VLRQNALGFGSGVVADNDLPKGSVQGLLVERIEQPPKPQRAIVRSDNY
jgi:hypothetical protein